MKDKFIMVAGVGASKFLQLLFSLFLSYQFDHGALATFVLIITLSVAMSSIVSLGGSPQIIRAGAFENPKIHISTTIRTAIFLIGIVLLILVSYVLFGQHKFYINNFSKWDYFFNTALIVVSLSIYSIIQSYLSYKQHYLRLGISALIIYSVPFLMSIVLSFFCESAKYIIVFYSILFFISTLIVYIATVGKEIEFKDINFSSLNFFVLSSNIFNFFRVAIFGFVTMLCLYFSVKYVNNTFDEQKIAVYSVSFQFFQIGTFLPGVLGSVFIPKIIESKGSQVQYNKMKMVYILIALFWLLSCLLIVYPIFKIYQFNINSELLFTFFIMQFCVLLSSLQAFYNQKYVADGSFGILGFSAIIWGGVLLILQSLLPKDLFMSSVALFLAYISSLIFFKVISVVCGNNYFKYEGN